MHRELPQISKKICQEGKDEVKFNRMRSRMHPAPHSISVIEGNHSRAWVK